MPHGVAAGHVDEARLVCAGHFGGVPSGVVFIGLLESRVGDCQHAVACRSVAVHAGGRGGVEYRAHQLGLLVASATFKGADNKLPLVVVAPAALVEHGFNPADE